jgi:sn-glycerol 3-phosphate transport system ATP-binding protein
MVMNAGRIEQIGTPEEVYGTPATIFVAGFIGSPPMNLLHGQADGANFTVGEARLPLPAAAPRNGALILGVRPEHLALDAQGPLPMKVDVVEMLGAERLVYGQLGAASLTLRIDGTLAPPRSGDTVHLRLPAERMHWFDVANGQRVR